MGIPINKHTSHGEAKRDEIKDEKVRQFQWVGKSAGRCQGRQGKVREQLGEDTAAEGEGTHRRRLIS